MIKENLGIARELSIVMVNSNTGIIDKILDFKLSDSHVAYFEERLMQQVKDQAGYGVGSCTADIVHLPLLAPKAYNADEVITLTTSVFATNQP